MKKLIYIFLILLGFTSCMKDDKVTLEPDATDKVDIIFGVNLPEPLVNTKAMADKPQVQNLYVAVFGGSGYLKEYVKAELQDSDKATENTTLYNYKVSLSLSDSHLKVHFIANAPTSIQFKYEDEVMPTLTKSGNEDAYWQRIELPNGITAKRYTSDDTEHTPPHYASGDLMKDGAGHYIVSDETLNYFNPVEEGVETGIPLIRNFAKIQVEETVSNFEITSYLLVNKPNSGSIAAYNKNTYKFVDNYHKLTFEQIKSQYPGNLPASATINTDVPSESDFPENATPVYMYERPIPTENATFLLVKGKYNGETCYYKIQLQDQAGNYYAIYRNFVYTITITGIARKGESTPQAAANASGSGDISTDQKAENLTDVSDGVARILVEYTEKTLIGQGDVTLKFKFYPNASSNTTANNQVTVTKGEAGSSGAVINGDVTIASSDDSEGWRTITFTSTTPGDVIKSQSIKVIGTYGGGSTLFRTVTYKLMSKQPLQVVCSPKEVKETKGERVDVLIKIPKGLPRSIFPLHFKIESSALSITPFNDNLPVSPGKSIIDNTTASYQFIKTLDYDDYLVLQDASTDEWVTITTHFKTTKDHSDCDVYVYNQYFKTDTDTNHDSFSTYTMHNFEFVKFDRKDWSEPNKPVVLSFQWQTAEKPAKINIKLTGLVPAAGETRLTQVGTSNTYEYIPETSVSVTLNLLTSNAEGYYRADLSAIHYYDAYCDNLLTYGSPGFTGSSVPFGVGKNVPFSFTYNSSAVGEPVIFTLSNLTVTDGQFRDMGDNKWMFTPTNTSAATHSFNFVTTKFLADVAVTSMVGDSYTQAGPFTLAAPTSLTIPAQALNFTGNNRPGNNTSVTLYNSTGVVVGTCTVSSYSGGGWDWNTYYRNNADISVNLTKFSDNESVYFVWESEDWWGNITTYYSDPCTLTLLQNATTTNRQDISGFSTNKPTTFP